MSERRFIRPQHDVIARVLGALRTDFVLDCECWFGDGTAIVIYVSVRNLGLQAGEG